MNRETIIILGIPIDNLDMDATVDRIFSMIESFKSDSVARQVATVNVDFVVNTLTWRLDRIRHPELIDILRRADLVTADGMPIVWISRLLGNPLGERVTGADLVPRLAEHAASQGKSIYFLGGREGVGQSAAEALTKRYPQLQIAGIDSPFVHVENESLEWAAEDDLPVIARINQAKPDILLIAFGNPKQEVWFHRNRNRLQVPVSIGVGGTFEFIVGTVRRAPPWIQKTGFEWLFRITQDPKRLWKRYFVGFFKFGLMVLPAIMYHRYRRMVAGSGEAGDPDSLSGHTEPVQAEPVQETSCCCFRIIRMPRRFDVSFLHGNGGGTLEAQSANAQLVLDFNDTTFIDSSGLGLLVRLWRQTSQNTRTIFFLNIGPVLERFFKLNRMWDLFKDHIFSDFEEITASMKDAGTRLPFSYAVQIEPGFNILKLYGRLDAAQMSALDLEAMLNDISQSHAILDLEELDFVDSSGLALFIKLQKPLAQAEKQLILCNPKDPVKQMLRITRLTKLFALTPDLPSAEKRLEQSL
ncbi:WecB/TagA/CpsF family glycosyltransferase [Desulfobacter vibrioformis]|uniref:WecB/TagA/CpsF family glycosyltransferase n=1 Tax=Desulfobacter vibrioformis TaxID=34031 RepID=UPI00068E0FB7|nr:WecB/TagA/CpsF family glycosyltransferase [Desulfobacter vibrioformis]